MEYLRLLGLPSREPSIWQRLQRLYKYLHNVQDTKTLVPILQKIFNCVRNKTQSHSSDTSEDNKHFSGLEIFLDDISSSEERNVFFQTILPEIAKLASLLDVNISSVNLRHFSRAQGNVFRYYFIAD